jgi:hypothetical protein
MDRVRMLFFSKVTVLSERPLQISANSHQSRGGTSLVSSLRYKTNGWFQIPSNHRHLHLQDPVLFTGTIASNIAYGNENALREHIEAAAREANCEFVWGLPDGFDTQSGSI